MLQLSRLSRFVAESNSECYVTQALLIVPSTIDGFGAQLELLTKALGKSIQTTSQLESPAFNRKFSQLLHGVLESLQSIRRLDLE